MIVMKISVMVIVMYIEIRIFLRWLRMCSNMGKFFG